jgi:hypothetical protein
MALCLMVLLMLLSGTAVSSSSDTVVASASSALQVRSTIFDITTASDKPTTLESCEKQSCKKLTNMPQSPADSIKAEDARPTTTGVDTASAIDSMARIPVKVPTTFLTVSSASKRSGETVGLDGRDDTSWALACYKKGRQIPDK